MMSQAIAGDVTIATISAEVTTTALPMVAPVTAGLRAYVAPVERTTGTVIPFDVATQGRFPLDSPPDGWHDVNVATDFIPATETQVDAVRSGVPLETRMQVRSRRGATVSWSFAQWGKLQMALGHGAQNQNVLLPEEAVLLGSGSTDSVLQLATPHPVEAGDLVAVDVDYAGATGYVGSGVAGAYVADASAINDVQYVRRITFNVARVLSVDGVTVTLSSPLIAGVPADGMKVSRVAGLMDVDGDSFFQEWSALFVAEGVQGDRLIFYFPRLQSVGGASVSTKLHGVFDRWTLKVEMRALPVVDRVTGEDSFFYRMYMPAPMREV